jgi:ABC-2 type transport system permease protein
MKQLVAFIKKEFFHIVRDVRTMLILFGIPVVQLLVFGTVIKSEIKDVRIAIYDPSNDETTQRITHKLLSSGYFLLEEVLYNTHDMERIFREGKIKEVVIFGPDFGNRLVKEGQADLQIIADASDPNVARLVTNYTKGIVNDFVRQEFPGLQMPHSLQTDVRMFYNENLKSVYMFVPGIMAMILMLISAMMTSISITREKEMGTMEVLLASPLRPAQIIAGKVTPYLLLSIINGLTIILIGKFVFDVPVSGSSVLLMGETILFIMMALCLGILISTVANSQLVAIFISMIGLMLPTIILSGFIFPIDNMPGILRILSYIMPARWFIEILRSIMLKGVGIPYIWQETLIISGMMILFVAISIKKFKIRLE